MPTSLEVAQRLVRHGDAHGVDDSEQVDDFLRDRPGQRWQVPDDGEPVMSEYSAEPILLHAGGR